MRQKNREGYVYFISCREYIKIGFAEEPMKRLGGLQVGNPFKLRIVKSISGTMERETYFHNIFDKYWVRGEWFRNIGTLQAFILDISTEDLAELSRINEELSKEPEYLED